MGISLCRATRGRAQWRRGTMEEGNNGGGEQWRMGYVSFGYKL